jgi:hypothetical protein
LYQWVTEPRALRTLLREQEESDGRLSVRLSRDRHFHWKTYILVKRHTARVVIGSSNLTGEGLHETGELNVVLSLDTKSKGFVELSRVFKRHWEKNSKPLTDEIVTKYEGLRKDIAQVLKPPSVPIRRILGQEPRAKVESPREVRYWRTWILGHLQDETLDLLSKTTDWDRRKYGYFAMGDRVCDPETR